MVHGPTPRRATCSELGYGMVTRDAHALAELRFATLVLDEAHGIKNAMTRRARAVGRIQAGFRAAQQFGRWCGRSAYDAIRDESAQAILQGASDEAAGLAALCEPADPAGHRRALVLELRAPAEDEEARAFGCLEGHAVGVLLALEEVGARVRPYPRASREGGALRWTIGCEGGDPGRLLAAARATLAAFTGGGEWPGGAELTAQWRG